MHSRDLIWVIFMFPLLSHRMVHDREISLFDGTRLLRHDRYEAVKQDAGLTDEQMTERFVP